MSTSDQFSLQIALSWTVLNWAELNWIQLNRTQLSWLNWAQPSWIQLNKLNSIQLDGAQLNLSELHSINPDELNWTEQAQLNSTHLTKLFYFSPEMSTSAHFSPKISTSAHFSPKISASESEHFSLEISTFDHSPTLFCLPPFSILHTLLFYDSTHSFSLSVTREFLIQTSFDWARLYETSFVLWKPAKVCSCKLPSCKFAFEVSSAKAFAIFCGCSPVCANALVNLDMYKPVSHNKSWLSMLQVTCQLTGASYLWSALMHIDMCHYTRRFFRKNPWAPHSTHRTGCRKDKLTMENAHPNGRVRNWNAMQKTIKQRAYEKYTSVVSFDRSNCESAKQNEYWWKLKPQIPMSQQQMWKEIRTHCDSNS